MEYVWYNLVLLILFGILIGIVAILGGIGGGVISVPIMVLIFGITEDIAVGSSTLIIIISSGFGFLLLKRQARINVKFCLLCSLFTIFGSLISTVVFLIFPIDNYLLRLIFSCAMIYVSLNLILKKNKTKKRIEKIENGNQNEVFSLELKNYSDIIKKGIPMFLLAGFLANLLGIGGGVINSPTLHFMFQFPIHYATANSTGIVFFTAVYNVIAKALLGKIDFVVGILIALGGIVGAYIGAKVSQKLSRRKLTLILGFILFIGAIRLFFP